LDCPVVTAAGVAKVGVEAVFFHHSPVQIPGDSSPYFAQGVYFGIFSDRREGERVDAHVGRIGITANTLSVVRLPKYKSAHAAFLCGYIARFYRGNQGKPVAPAFAHLFGIAEATGLARAAGQAVGDAVSVFVRDDTVVEITVELIRTGGFEGRVPVKYSAHCRHTGAASRNPIWSSLTVGIVTWPPTAPAAMPNVAVSSKPQMMQPMAPDFVGH
jgi:hypothetical protein